MAAAQGDPASRAWLVQHFTPVVFRYAMRTLGNEEDARDAAQDTMVKVLRNLERYEDRWRFITWVLSIARNTCIDEFRRRKRLVDIDAPDIPDTAAGPQELSSRKERAERLHEALQTLPPLYRDVLVLYHFEHLKYKEIADMLGIPIGTVMNRIFRARRKLREAYDQASAIDPAIAPGGQLHEA